MKVNMDNLTIEQVKKLVILKQEQIQQLKQQLEAYKSEYNDVYASDLETLSIEQLKKRIVLMHSWVKHHQGSVERKCKQYNDFKKEAVELIRLAEIEMKSWCNLSGLDADDIHEWYLLKDKFLAKYRGE